MAISKNSSQRLIIWIITIVMAVGSVGAYFVIILENNSQSQAAASVPTNKVQNPIVDPTAYRVQGKVEALEVTDEVAGTGAAVKPTDTVEVNYKGTIAQTGVKFDSTFDTGQPFTTPLSSVIPGWQQGLVGMKVGGKRRLVIPAALAYGSQSPAAAIPPNSDLVFEIQLLAINPSSN